MDEPSWVLNLNTVMRRAVLESAIPSDTRKWNDHLGIPENWVATSGDANAPTPAWVKHIIGP